MSASAYTLHFKNIQTFHGSTKVVVGAPNEGATFCISVDHPDMKKAFVVHYDGENICGAAAFIAGQFPKYGTKVEEWTLSPNDGPFLKLDIYAEVAAQLADC